MPLISDAIVQQRRQRRQLAGSRDPLYQDFNTTRYTDIWIGTPLQRQTLLIDTTLAVVVVPCAGCSSSSGDGDSNNNDDCERAWVEFVPRASSTFQYDTCNVTTGLGCTLGKCEPRPNVDNNNNNNNTADSDDDADWWAHLPHDVLPVNESLCRAVYNRAGGRGGGVSSWEAVEVTDEVVSFANEIPFRLAFGCQTTIVAGAAAQKILADGRMGLTHSRLARSYWQQAVAAGTIQTGMFTLCFSSLIRGQNTGRHAGALVLGGRALVNNATTPSFARLLDGTRSSKDYRVAWVGMELVVPSHNKKKHVPPIPVTASHKSAIPIQLDSTRESTTLSSAYKQSFTQYFSSLTGQEFGSKIKLSSDKNDIDTILPTIVLLLESTVSSSPNVQWPVRPSHYMEYFPDGDYYKPRLQFQTQSVLGADFMQGLELVFDLDQGRLGITESDCEFLELPAYDGTRGDYRNHPYDGPGDTGELGRESASTRSAGTSSLLKFALLLLVGALGVFLWAMRQEFDDDGYGTLAMAADDEDDAINMHEGGYRDTEMVEQKPRFHD